MRGVRRCTRRAPRQRPARPASLARSDPALLERLRATYCGPLGAEFDHCDTAAERVWWAEQLESRMPTFTATPATQRNAAVAMLQADTFEQFLARKYVSLKRYSGEGTEALLPALDAVFAAAAGAGVRDAVIGMAHRGRLAVLVSLLGYPARKLFHKIHGYDAFPGEVQGVDDVTSHIAAAADKVYGGKSAIHVSLLHNPSHLEAVNPVAAGKTRAKRDLGSSAALCIQIHGDAAVYGQGVVAETYAMSALPVSGPLRSRRFLSTPPPTPHAALPSRAHRRGMTSVALYTSSPTTRWASPRTAASRAAAATPATVPRP